MTTPLSQKPHSRGAPFSLANKLERVAFHAVWLAVARFTPPSLHRWRRFVLRAFGARIGAGVRIHGSARVWLPRNLEIGPGALIGPGVRLYNQGAVAIGADSVISQRAHICASSHRIDDPGFELALRPVSIGAGCWVAAEAFVGPGVTMGDGAVLAARGALFGDAAPMGVYRGNPAVQIGTRELSGRELPGAS